MVAMVKTGAGLKDCLDLTRFGKIGVLMGGPSKEREISLKSGKTVYESLKQLGLDVITLDIKTDDINQNVKLIRSARINCAFLALHGYFGEDGQIQGLLQALGIPYTGSAAEASRLAMDKIASRKIFEIYGLSVPRHRIINRVSYNKNRKAINHLRFPLVVKPATGGSSIGLSIVDREQDLDSAIVMALRFDERLLIEEYIRGRELTVGILGDRTLPIIEIIPKKRFFDYEAKYKPGLTEYVVPAKLEEAEAKKIEDIALLAHRLLGCFGCSRVDMILSNDNIPFILEVNTIPGLTRTSLLPKACQDIGIEFAQLCLKLIKLAYGREKKSWLSS